MVALVLALATLGILALATADLLTLLLDDRVGFAVALALIMGGSAAMFWLRGIFGGQRRFGSYASTLLIDAGVRIIGIVGLALAGSTSRSGMRWRSAPARWWRSGRWRCCARPAG